jgi:hypothetical protein
MNKTGTTYTLENLLDALADKGFDSEEAISYFVNSMEISTEVYNEILSEADEMNDE